MLTADIVPFEGGYRSHTSFYAISSLVFLFLSSKINRLQTLRSVTLSSKTTNQKMLKLGAAVPLAPSAPG